MLRRIAVCAIVLLICPLRTHATIILFIFTPDGIVAGADGRAIHEMGKPSSDTTIKLVVVQGHIAVASMNLLSLESSGVTDPIAARRFVIHYDFLSWISHIEKTLPQRITIASLADTVAQESKQAFSHVGVLIALGRLPKKDFLNDTFVTYLVGGCENGYTSLYEIDYKINWKEKKLDGPIFQVEVAPGKHFGLYAPAGITTTGQVYSGKGDWYREAVVYDSKVGDLAHTPLSMSDAVGVMKALLKVEYHHVAVIGPPFKIISLPTSGRVTVRIFHSL